MTDGPYSVPGNPGALRAAASSWSQAASCMGSAAGQVRSAGLSSGDFSGQAAVAHADQVKALAAAHQVARDALFSASGALEAYATALEAAQAKATKANVASAQVSSLQKQLANPPAGNPAVTARFGPVAGSDPTYTLQNQLSAAQTNVALGPQAVSDAIAAAHRVVTAFNSIAALAGNPADHHLTNPWEAYLGQGSLVDVAKTLITATDDSSLAGLNRHVENNDQSVFSDFAASPATRASSGAFNLIKQQLAAESASEKLISGLRATLLGNRIILPPGLANLDPSQQATALALLWAGYQQEQAPSPGFIKFMKVTSVVLGGVALVTAWIPLFDGASTGAAVSSEAVTEGAELSLSRVAELTSAATGGASAGIDFTTQASTGNWDPIALTFDLASAIPGLAAVARGTAETEVGAQIDLLKATPGYSPAELKELQETKESIALGHQIWGAVGAPVGLTPVVYGAATLGVPDPSDPGAANALKPNVVPEPQVNPATARFGPGPWGK